jgi:hypothetical protein
MDHVLIDANTFPSSNLFSGHSASTRPEASSPPSPDVAHQPAVLLLRHEHVPSAAGAHVSSSVEDLRKYSSMKTRSDELSELCGGLRSAT